MDKVIALITKEEEQLVQRCIKEALRLGAREARAELSKNVMNLVGVRDSAIDKVSFCSDRSIQLVLFVDGRYGSGTTNDLNEERLMKFIGKTVENIRSIAPDECRHLPERKDICTDAKTGYECENFDESIFGFSDEERLAIALDACYKGSVPDGCKIVSEEGEYSDEIDSHYLADSKGLEARQVETIFEYGVETTVQDEDGERYVAFWWDSRPFFKDLNIKEIGAEALSRAAAQIHPKLCKSFCGKMVVDASASSKLVNPILDALNGMSIQQHESFLQDAPGKKVFGEGLTIESHPRKKGCAGSTYFDFEGIACKDSIIIDKGKVDHYFLSTYSAEKLGMELTQSTPRSLELRPWPKEGLSREDLLKLCGSGILVMGFNGGNSDPVTGNFSFGIEGFAFKDGKITHPIHEMLITGNLITLWNNLLAAASDSRACAKKKIPSLAFDNVNFNG